MTAKHPMIPFPVIVRAADGDIEAVNQIVRHYSGFIASRSMRPMPLFPEMPASALRQSSCLPLRLVWILILSFSSMSPPTKAQTMTSGQTIRYFWYLFFQLSAAWKQHLFSLAFQKPWNHSLFPGCLS